jgi:hypothetical protein
LKIAAERSNLPFDEWTSIFGSERLTGVLLSGHKDQGSQNPGFESDAGLVSRITRARLLLCGSRRAKPDPDKISEPHPWETGDRLGCPCCGG